MCVCGVVWSVVGVKVPDISEVNERIDEARSSNEDGASNDGTYTFGGPGGGPGGGTGGRTGDEVPVPVLFPVLFLVDPRGICRSGPGSIP